MYGAYSRQDDRERQSLGGGLLERLVPPVQMYEEPRRPISISDANPNALQMFKDVRQCFSDNGESKTNTTGIPDHMKQDFEEKSGLSFDDVQVHYNSDKPAQLQASAYTQGNDVFVGPGQEHHLGHELGHVVQQKQGMVSANTSVNGMPVNDDEGMEREADYNPLYSNSASVSFEKINNVIQLERVPTFYTYIKDKQRSTPTDLLSTLQGPHTVCHHFIEICLDSWYWQDIFDEQIKPYTTAVIDSIIKKEASPFPNYNLYLKTYDNLYTLLLGYATKPSSTTLSKLEAIDAGTMPSDYSTIRKQLMEIMEMHPYGSYAWNRSGCETLPFEMSGKGESVITIANYKSHIGKIIDPFAEFKDMPAYEQFLQKRLGDNTFRISPLLREQAITQVMSEKCSSIKSLFTSLYPICKAVLFYCKELSIAKIPSLLDMLKLSTIKDEIIQILNIQKFYTYPSVTQYNKLEHFTGNLQDFFIDGPKFTARQKDPFIAMKSQLDILLT